jgi:hypothetical protein
MICTPVLTRPEGAEGQEAEGVGLESDQAETELEQLADPYVFLGVGGRKRVQDGGREGQAPHGPRLGDDPLEHGAAGAVDSRVGRAHEEGEQGGQG